MFEAIQNDARRSRRMMRVNPWIMMEVLATNVVSFMPVQKGPTNDRRPDVNEILRALKEAGPDGTISF
jgi:hypothetical protein